MRDTRSIALVTGASSGIGSVYADRLAARGHDLILVARRRDRLEALAAKLRSDHGRIVDIVVADLTRDDDLARVESVVQATSGLSVLINNAGLTAQGSAATVDPTSVDGSIKLNVFALTRLSLAAARRFSAVKQGTIVNIGSVIAVTPRAELATYSGSKAFVLNFTRSLALELSGFGIAVQAVMPGPVRTEIFGDKPIPFPEDLIMTPEDLVDAALSALDQGETVTFPTLEKLEAWTEYERAREALFVALRSGNRPAKRYGVGQASGVGKHHIQPAFAGSTSAKA